MVQRLAKGVLPANTSLHKDAILAMSKGATVFINYLAHAANTASLSTGKRTIPPTAVIDALAELEFESFGPRVEAELKKFNEVQTGKRNEYRRKVREGKMSGVKGVEDGGGGEEEEEDDGGEGRAKKRVRREEGDEGMVMDDGDDGGGERRESGSRAGDPSAQLQTGYRDYGVEEPVEDDDDDDEDAEGRGENGASNTQQQQRPRGSREEEEEEEEEDENEDEEEEEEEDDDEDEYPDEGRRLSSVEREANGSFVGAQGDDDDDDDPGTSGGSSANSEEDDDGSD